MLRNATHCEYQSLATATLPLRTTSHRTPTLSGISNPKTHNCTQKTTYVRWNRLGGTRRYRISVRNWSATTHTRVLPSAVPGIWRTTSPTSLTLSLPVIRTICRAPSLPVPTTSVSRTSSSSAVPRTTAGARLQQENTSTATGPTDNSIPSVLPWQNCSTT